MDQTASVIAVRTVGMRPYQQAQLKAQLAAYPEIELRHLDKWSFRALAADVLVVGVDTHGGGSTLEVLESFQGAREPLVVTYSENDQRWHLLIGSTPQPPVAGGYRRSAGFYQCLQEALRKAGATRVRLDEVAEPEMVVSGFRGPGAASETHWAD